MVLCLILWLVWGWCVSVVVGVGWVLVCCVRCVGGVGGVGVVGGWSDGVRGGGRIGGGVSVVGVGVGIGSSDVCCVCSWGGVFVRVEDCWTDWCDCVWLDVLVRIVRCPVCV